MKTVKLILLFCVLTFTSNAQTWTWKGQGTEIITIQKTLATESYCELVLTITIDRERRQNFYMALWDEKQKRWLTINEQKCEGWIDFRKKQIGWNIGSKILTIQYTEL